MNSGPLVSVLMPVYNAERYVAEAVESILRQTFGDFEFIIIDDGSTDRSLEILHRNEKQDGRIRLISRENRGLVAALNEGLGIAGGEFIARMDADDISLPDRFEKQMKLLAQRPDVVALGGQMIIMGPDGRNIFHSDYRLDHEAIEAEHLVGRCGIAHPAVMYRRAPVLALGGYRMERLPAEDLDLWLRLGERGRLANLGDCVLRYRLHARSVSRTRARDQWRQTLQACKDAWHRRGQSARVMAISEECFASVDEWDKWAWQAWASGFRGTARRYSLRAVVEAPSEVSSWKLLACAWLKNPKTKRWFA